MYIKLTKLDGSPIWLNASFVVTIEPRRGGGAVVVPVGDGLDYDVREAPEKVLAMLGDAPAPAILPIPTSDALTKPPADVSPESDNQLVNEARQTPPPKPAPKPTPVANAPAPTAEATTETTGTTGTAESGGTTGTTGTTETAEVAAPDVFEEAIPEKPAKRTRKATAAKKPRATRRKKPELPIPEDQVERLKKMMPKSVQKLQNTLQTQFKVEDAESAVKALEANGVFTLDRDHVVWGN